MTIFEEIRAKLKEYGGDLSDTNEIITTSGKASGVTISLVKKTRLHMRSQLGLLASGPPIVETVESFVKKYWYWVKL